MSIVFTTAGNRADVDYHDHQYLLQWNAERLCSQWMGYDQ